MNVRDVLHDAGRAVRSAVTPQEFTARPMYGVGYMPIPRADELGEVDDVPPTPDTAEAWRSARASNETANTAWLLIAGALVLAAMMDFAVLARDKRRAREGARS